VHNGGYSPLCEPLGGCRVNRTSYQKQGGLLQSLPIPTGPWHCICMDFITILPEPQEYDAILLMVVRFAKLGHMVPIVGTATALETAQPFLKCWWRHHGLPRVIVTDRDPKFSNAFWMHFARKVGMKSKFSMAFHSKMVRNTERVNGISNQYSRNLVGVDQRDWANYVGQAEFR
jgi:hypothetical protein